MSLIFVDKDIEKWEHDFTLFHELGHLLFNHLGMKERIPYERCEGQADVFASTMIALKLCKEYPGLLDKTDWEGLDI